MKTQRQAKLLELLQAGKVASQLAAVELLKESSFDVTQATVSRDLEELGAVKVKDGFGDNVSTRYAILDTAPGYGASLSQVIRQFVVGKAISGNLLVLRTPPGHANAVAGG